MPADSTPLPAYRLTAERRFQCCVHEAGHAIAAALADRQSLELAVAPEGAEKWCPVTSRGRRLDDLWGFCASHPIPLPLAHLKWDSETLGGFNLAPARRVHTTLLKHLQKPIFRAVYYLDLRAALCGFVAGEIAEALLLNEEPWLESDYTGPDDINKAEACCDLLPYRNGREFDHAVDQTTAALRDHWPAVMNLATALARAGALDEDTIRPFLPEPLKGWPTPPPRRVRR